MGHLVSSLGLVRDGLPTLAELGAQPLQITDEVCPAVEIDASFQLMLDTDGDGVRNFSDQCPGTPPGTPVDAKGCATAVESLVVAKATVEFANDSARIEPSSNGNIEDVGKLLAQNPEAQALVIGHASRTGAPAYNQALSVRRAEAVAQRLVDEFGVERLQIKTQGMGFYQPRFTVDAAAAVNANRRADITVSAPGPVAVTN